MEKTSVLKHRIMTRAEKVKDLLLFLSSDTYEEKEPEKAQTLRKCDNLIDEILKNLEKIKE